MIRCVNMKKKLTEEHSGTRGPLYDHIWLNVSSDVWHATVGKVSRKVFEKASDQALNNVRAQILSRLK